MTRGPVVGLAALVAVAGVVPAVSGPQTAAVQTSETFQGEESGDSLYRTYCATCHGASGKGDGVLASSLRVRPSDLTRLTKKDEKFDAERVAKVIDGRQEVKGHGGSDMPQWGDAFKRSGEGYSEKAVKARIGALTTYIETLQVK
ncbi:MAG TPA: c-type cytochrome [Vicinamibacteria bacterium]|nr:c-type cytochrome [Vicinamibacteria bacterium]